MAKASRADLVAAAPAMPGPMEAQQESAEGLLVDSGNYTDSDEERDLVTALAQRATDPFIKQRKARGRFMFIKVAGCDGFHCYEDELWERLARVGITWAPSAVEKAGKAAEGAELKRSPSAASQTSNISIKQQRSSAQQQRRSSKTAAAGELLSSDMIRSSSDAGRKQGKRVSQQHQPDEGTDAHQQLSSSKATAAAKQPKEQAEASEAQAKSTSSRRRHSVEQMRASIDGGGASGQRLEHMQSQEAAAPAADALPAGRAHGRQAAAQRREARLSATSAADDEHGTAKYRAPRMRQDKGPNAGGEGRRASTPGDTLTTEQVRPTAADKQHRRSSQTAAAGSAARELAAAQTLPAQTPATTAPSEADKQQRRSLQHAAPTSNTAVDPAHAQNAPPPMLQPAGADQQHGVKGANAREPSAALHANGKEEPNSAHEAATETPTPAAAAVAAGDATAEAGTSSVAAAAGADGSSGAGMRLSRRQRLSKDDLKAAASQAAAVFKDVKDVDAQGAAAAAKGVSLGTA